MSGHVAHSSVCTLLLGAIRCARGPLEGSLCSKGWSFYSFPRFPPLYSCFYCSFVLMFSCFLINGYSEAHQKVRGCPLLSTRKPASRYAETHEAILGSPMSSEQILSCDVDEYADAHYAIHKLEVFQSSWSVSLYRSSISQQV